MLMLYCTNGVIWYWIRKPININITFYSCFSFFVVVQSYVMSVLIFLLLYWLLLNIFSLQKTLKNILSKSLFIDRNFKRGSWKLKFISFLVQIEIDIVVIVIVVHIWNCYITYNINSILTTFGSSSKTQ